MIIIHIVNNNTSFIKNQVDGRNNLNMLGFKIYLVKENRVKANHENWGKLYLKI